MHPPIAMRLLPALADSMSQLVFLHQGNADAAQQEPQRLYWQAPRQRQVLEIKGTIFDRAMGAAIALEAGSTRREVEPQPYFQRLFGDDVGRGDRALPPPALPHCSRRLVR
jgi:hypothetical protein